MSTLYLFLGGIGSGKSALAGFITQNEKFRHIEFVCADIYKNIHFGDGSNLKLNYKKASDYMRYKIERLVAEQKSLIVEMVPSKPEKLKLISDLKSNKAYTVIAFYIGTTDATTNTNRVAKRITQGGDPVQEEKTKNRHEVCLSNIAEIMELTDQMYFLDNSGLRIKIVACQNQCNLHIYAQTGWFEQYVLKKINHN